MSIDILGIERLQYYPDNHISYSGTLRNAIRFNIDDLVYFTVMDGNSPILVSCEVIGVERTTEQNAQYKYKIRLPRDIVERLGEETRSNLKCDEIFKNIDDAKRSALKRLDLNYKLKKESLERFFNKHK